jgi:hypothetical protein
MKAKQRPWWWWIANPTHSGLALQDEPLAFAGVYAAGINLVYQLHAMGCGPGALRVAAVLAVLAFGTSTTASSSSFRLHVTLTCFQLLSGCVGMLVCCCKPLLCPTCIAHKSDYPAYTVGSEGMHRIIYFAGHGYQSFQMLRAASIIRGAARLLLPFRCKSHANECLCERRVFACNGVAASQHSQGCTCESNKC